MGIIKFLISLILICDSLFAQNPFNNALFLDGDEDFINTHSPVFLNLSAVTITVWVKADSGGQIISNHIGGITWESVEFNTGGFLINSSNSNLTRQQLIFPSISDSSWHHIAAVWDGSEIRVYLDGLAYGDSLDAFNQPWNDKSKIQILKLIQ